eukprot:Platyproteum_vivax@DN6924_c0_g1_i2.p1
MLRRFPAAVLPKNWQRWAVQFYSNRPLGDPESWYTPLVGQTYTNFISDTVMPNGTIKQVALSDFANKVNVYLLFYPLDFTYVCPSELLAFGAALPLFEQRSVQVMGVSVDSVYAHQAWRKKAVRDGGIGTLNFPIVSDVSKNICRLYGLLLGEAKALRGSFLIDKEGIVQHACINNLSVGRSVSEALRIVDAMQHVEKSGEVCPADWTAGQEGMVETEEGVKKYLSNKF